tara:strand:- start:4090 stop:4425 length:336 start_codon:yes stop_codon:yes gene_type:complete
MQNTLPENFLETMWAMSDEEKAMSALKGELKADMLETCRLERNALIVAGKCHKCHGTGLFVRSSFAYGTVVGSRHGKDCFTCKGTGKKKGSVAELSALDAEQALTKAAFAV